MRQKWNNPFISLRHKNFRYYWFGMCISLIGTWMQNIAQPWLAYTLTKSPFLLSLVGALQFTPMLFFSLFAGVIVDRLNKKNILFFTQTASLIITFILAILVWLGNIQYWHILILATVLGMVNTLDMPTRQAFIIELVGKEDLVNAIALNSSVFNIARIIGPGVAGIVIGYLGIASCFFINSLSFGAVIISLFFIKPGVNTEKKVQVRENILKEIKDGLSYIYKQKFLLRTVLTMAIVGTFAMNFNVLIPVFTKVVLRQNEASFGFLMSFMGAGSLLGAITLATTSSAGPQNFNLQISPYFVAVLLIITSFLNSFALIALCLFASGFYFVRFSSTANSTLQIYTENEYRGRVMSIYSLVFTGSTPFGNLYAGAITNKFGPRMGFIACGLAVIIPLLILALVNRFDAKVKSV